MTRKVIRKTLPPKNTGQQFRDHPVTVGLVDLHDLEVSLAPGARTQREATRARIDKLKREWDTNAAGVITVNLRDGKKFVVDGWGRVSAAKEMGVPQLWAEVHTGLSVEEEARLFRIKNKELKAVGVLDLYLVALTEGEATAVATDAVLTKHNLVMGASGNNGVRGVAAVQKAVAMHGDTIVDRAFTVAELAWGRQQSTWEGVIIGGLSRFLARYGDVATSDKELASKLQKVGAHPDVVVNKVRDLATRGHTQFDGSEGRLKAMSQLIVAEWNRGRRNEALRLSYEAA